MAPGDPCPICHGHPRAFQRTGGHACACRGSGRWNFTARRGAKPGRVDRRKWSLWEDHVIRNCFTLPDPELEAWRRLHNLQAGRSYDAVYDRYMKLSAAAKRGRNRMVKGSIPEAAVV